MSKLFANFAGTFSFITIGGGSIQTFKTSWINSEEQRLNELLKIPLDSESTTDIILTLQNIEKWKKKSFFEQIIRQPDYFPLKFR